MSKLSEEITNDPLVRGYIGMTNAEVANSLMNTIDRSITSQYLAGSDIFNATDDLEYAGLTDIGKDSWDRLCAIETVDTLSGIAKSREVELFGIGTTTRANLIAIRITTVSRAQELSLGNVDEGDVIQARAL